jgi:hypothetical protein
LWQCGIRMCGILKIFPENLRLNIFLKISILFADIFREIEAFCNKCEGFLNIARFLKYIFSGIEAFLKRCEAF